MYIFVFQANLFFFFRLQRSNATFELQLAFTSSLMWILFQPMMIEWYTLEMARKMNVVLGIQSAKMHEIIVRLKLFMRYLLLVDFFHTFRFAKFLASANFELSKMKMLFIKEIFCANFNHEICIYSLAECLH